MPADRPFFFDPDQLAALADARREAYADASPFPHAVFDDFLPADVLAEVLAEFPRPDDIPWRQHYHDNSRKLACSDENHMGPRSRHLFAQLNASTFTGFLESLTGIEGLIPDPHLEGGGYHFIERGGRLEVHADFNRHDRLRLDRRLNLLVFLNRDWQEEWGGHLELWTTDMKTCVQRVLPVFNRAVLFSTTDRSFHGHPHPLQCPESRARRSIALYYYTAGRPPEEASDRHSTLYQVRPGEEGGARKRRGLARLFQARR